MEVTLDVLSSVAAGECLYEPKTLEEKEMISLYARALELSTNPLPVLDAYAVVAALHDMASEMARYLRAHESGDVYTFRIPRGGTRLNLLWPLVKEMTSDAGLVIYEPFDIPESTYGRRGTQQIEGEPATKLVLPGDIQEAIRNKNLYGFEDIIDRGTTIIKATKDARSNGAAGLGAVGFIAREGNVLPSYEGLEIIYIAHTLKEKAWFDGGWCMDYKYLFRNLLPLHAMHDYVVKPLKDLSKEPTAEQRKVREEFEKIGGYTDADGNHVDGDLDKLTVEGMPAVDFIEEELPPMLWDQIMAYK